MLQKISDLRQRWNSATDTNSKYVIAFATVLTGTLIVSLLAQISIRLPWTLIPLTGQTFGVALIALLWGRTKSSLSMLLYMFVGGVLHWPVFANGASGLLIGPTFGYLIGMTLATLVMGTLADRGWTNTYLKTYLAAVAGSVVTFSVGLFFLGHFVPSGTLLAVGLWPFLPGDLIKSLAAAAIVRKLRKDKNRQPLSAR